MKSEQTITNEQAARAMAKKRFNKQQRQRFPLTVALIVAALLVELFISNLPT